MSALLRGSGLTETERYLAKLADRTFLRLWSYPNPFFEKREGGRVHRRELADLLVVCGDDVLIFSDKAITWSASQPREIAWRRWYGRAIEKSISQICGAERQLARDPNNIFLDPSCIQRFPIDLPPIGRRRVHGIIVAIGVTETIREFYDDLSGTFPIRTSLKGSDHSNIELNENLPFSLGDVNPTGLFVHIFDPSALSIVMRELDTITDFVDYLTKRGEFIRSDRFLGASGEEDLLAFFLQNPTSDGSHEFITSQINCDFPNYPLFIGYGEHKFFIRSDEYIRKKQVDRISYMWDKLIDVFVEHVIDGTAVELLGQKPDAAIAERSLRFMALECRVRRRLLGAAVCDTLIKAQAPGIERFVKRIVPDHSVNGLKIGYVILVLAFPKHLASSVTYEMYRTTRAEILQLYCMDLFDKFENLDIVVGIGLDAVPDLSREHAGSEDVMAFEKPIWTEETRALLEEGRKEWDVKPITSASMYMARTYEYPLPEKNSLSRQQRRAQERAQKKAASSLSGLTAAVLAG